MEQNNKRRAEDAERQADKLEWDSPENIALANEMSERLQHYAQPAAPAVDAAKLDDLGKLKALAEAATKGPWMRLFGERTVYDRLEDGCRGNAIVRADLAFSVTDAANLDFIAAANPAAILRIAALVAQQAARIAELDKLIGRAITHLELGSHSISFVNTLRATQEGK